MSVFTLYRFYAADDALLYIGLTVNPGQRFTNHAHKKEWWVDVAKVTLEQHPDYPALVVAEREAIQAEKPLHNIIYNGKPRYVAEPRRLFKGMEVGNVYGLGLHDGSFLICLIEEGDEIGVCVIPWMPTNELFAGQPRWVDGAEIARIKTCGRMSIEDKIAEGYTADQNVFDISTLTGYGDWWIDSHELEMRVKADLDAWT